MSVLHSIKLCIEGLAIAKEFSKIMGAREGLGAKAVPKWMSEPGNLKQGLDKAKNIGRMSHQPLDFSMAPEGALRVAGDLSLDGSQPPKLRRRKTAGQPAGAGAEVSALDGHR